MSTDVRGRYRNLASALALTFAMAWATTPTVVAGDETAREEKYRESANQHIDQTLRLLGSTDHLMWRSIEQGDFVTVQELARRQAPVNIFDELGYTPLFLVVKKAHGVPGKWMSGDPVVTVKRLLAAGASVDRGSGYGAYERKVVASRPASERPKEEPNYKMPLHVAAQDGHQEIAALLIAAGADVTATTHFREETPLYLAALYGWPEIVRMLLSAGADVNATAGQWEGGRTPLQAVEHGQPGGPAPST